MINREDWNGKKYEEMADAMQIDLILYKDKVASFNSVEECEEEEKELMKLMDEQNARLSTVKYALPEEAEYDGNIYKKDDIANMIIDFINKLEVKYENTLGLYQLVNIWASKQTDIKYHVYDSTLRCLNQVTFKGYEEWSKILIVNEYLATCHNEYALDTGMLVYFSECHNALIDKMDEINKPANKPAEVVNE